MGLTAYSGELHVPVNWKGWEPQFCNLELV
jgi:hypothetical protein